jgi:SAM-dependent methyltransferase
MMPYDAGLVPDRQPSRTSDDLHAAERAEVERASGHYYYSRQQLGIDARTKALVMERCLPHLRGPLVLDLGFVEGAWTDAVLGLGHRVDIVEGATKHAQFARDRYAADPRVRVFETLFQELMPVDRYHTIVAGDMLRYLPDPLAFLAEARGWLAQDGRVIVTVPNRRSLHRRVGTLMGAERSLDDDNARDREVGNRRSYDRYELRRLLQDAGYEIAILRGAFLKPLASAQMEGWSDDLLRAFLEIGDELEDYAWFLWAVATPAGSR